MAKLNKTEIDALVHKVYRELEAEVRIYNDSLVSEERYNSWLKIFSKTSTYKTLVDYYKLNEFISKIPAFPRGYSKGLVYSLDKDWVEKSCRNIFEDKMKINKKIVTVSTDRLREEIIIHQIDNSNDINTFIDKLIKQFSIVNNKNNK